MNHNRKEDYYEYEESTSNNINNLIYIEKFRSSNKTNIEFGLISIKFSLTILTLWIVFFVVYPLSELL